MLKGDLASTPFSAVITDLAASDAGGCLHIESPDGDEALVYFKSGAIYSTHLPGRRPQLGARLISSGALAPEALEEALEAQATELQGWRLGELLVHLGFVEHEVVEAFGIEQVRDACFEISRWPAGKWKFRKNEKTREDVAGVSDVPGLLEETARREQEWTALADVIGRIDSIPVLGAGGLASAEMALNQEEWALLCKVDGERNVHQLARDCGFTDFEAGQIVSSLVASGLLEIDGVEDEEDEEDAEDDVADVVPIDTRSAASRLMQAFGGEQDMTETDISGADLEQPQIEDAGFFAAEQVTEEDLGAEPAEQVPAYSSSLVMPLVGSEQSWDDDPSGVDSEISRLLSADAGGYTAYSPPAVTAGVVFDEPEYADPEALLPRYSLGFERRDSFDESLSRVSEALSALLGAQGEEPAEEQYTQHLVDLSVDDEEDERALRIRAAAAAELAAAHAEMEEQRRRFDEARRKAEEQARAEAEQAQREAEAEAARIVAEQEAARVAAEEEAARIVAEQEAARVAAEAEAAHIAAEEEAARVAAEEEEGAARVAAEEEAARAAAEEEAARIATEAEAEAARIAAEEEAARVAAEQEAARRAAEEAAAAALLEEMEQNVPPPPPPPIQAPEHAPAQAMTDTASLMRELSSLGFDDEPSTPAPTRPSTPVGASARGSAPASDKGKKRKGLFGRG